MKKPPLRNYYTNEDVLRWEKVSLETIPFQTEKLRTEVDSNFRWQRFGNLSGVYESLAIVAISRKLLAEAMNFLRKSIEMDLEQHEIYRAQGKPISAGHFQEILLAFVTMDQPLISKMLSYYTWEDGVPESVYLGKIIKSLALGDISYAQMTLSQKRPKMEKMFAAYPDCLQAMINRDQGALQAAISVGSKNWAWRAARYEKGLPNSVCFLQGAGLVRLAEQVMETKLSISDEYIPAELLA